MSTSQVAWTSDDPTVATVSGGLVTAVKNGSSRISAASGAASASVSAAVLQRAAALTVTSGSSQTGTVGTALPAPLVVTARDSRANAVPGVAVNFAVSGGGTLNATTSTTGATGQASVTWTLGTSTAVAQSVVVTAPTMTGANATFTATALADTPVSAVKFAGDNQKWSITKPLPDPLSVRVIDRYNNGVAGTNVTFTAASGGGTVSSTSVPTNANGEATVVWTLGAAEGVQSVRGQLATPATLLIFIATGLRVDMGNIGPTPFKVGCSVAVFGAGYDLVTLSKNRVTIDGVVAPITGGDDLGGGGTSLIVTVPVLPNPAAHLATVQVTSFGTTVSDTASFDPASTSC